MKVKTYRAPTIKQALEEIKKELGPDAFILGRKEVQPKKLLGVFGKKYFEVAAAVDYSQSQKDTPMERGIERASATDRVELSQAATGKAELVKSSSTPKPKPVSSRSSSQAGNRALLNEIRSVKSLLQSLPLSTNEVRCAAASKPPSFAHPAYEDVYLNLVSQGIGQELAYELVDGARLAAKPSSIPKKMIITSRVLCNLSSRIRVADDVIAKRPENPVAIMAFLGPTGVGKTTTLAKLAAQAVLGNRLKVGLITMDTYRIAAVEQLKTYAEIIGVPTKVVETLAEMDAAIAGFKDKDLILIDTAGRSQREIHNQRELADFMAQSGFIQKALVVSATTKQADLAEIIETYKIFNHNCLILTKLDETQVYGPLINELARTGSPVAYVTVGQNVPKDISRPSARKMVKLALQPDPEGWDKFVSLPKATKPRSKTKSKAKVRKAANGVCH
jgi:flagellar biosynthesis protein FlhF